MSSGKNEAEPRKNILSAAHVVRRLGMAAIGTGVVLLVPAYANSMDDHHDSYAQYSTESAAEHAQLIDNLEALAPGAATVGAGVSALAASYYLLYRRQYLLMMDEVKWLSGDDLDIDDLW
jgi:hypothetical protein